MSQMPYYRDVWVLGPSSNGYPGSFPRGLINKIKMKWWGKKRLWMFSGSFEDSEGTTVDIKPECHPDIVADCSAIPLPDNSFDFVMLDPPYSEAEAKELYDLPYCSIPKVINEAARLVRPGGVVLILHRLVPMRHPTENLHKKRLKLIGLVGVCTITGYSNMRALSVWRKIEQLSE